MANFASLQVQGVYLERDPRKLERGKEGKEKEPKVYVDKLVAPRDNWI